MKSEPQRSTPPSCSLCGQYHLPVIPCETGYVCDICAEKARVGKDATTRAVKAKQRSLRAKADKERTMAAGLESRDLFDMDIATTELLSAESFQPQSGVSFIPGGEFSPQHSDDQANSLAAPHDVARDASAHRLDLVTRMGTDVAAMALDAAATFKAENSLERMLAHQMAVLHDTAMCNASKAALAQDPLHSVRMMNLSIRSMETFQKGLLTIKRLHGTGEQRITIQHVNVTQGGQAVIGQVQPIGVGSKP